MAAFRNAVQGTSVDNWSYADGVLSFSRGNKGFFAMSKQGFKTTVNTGLPGGEYCDLVSECAKKVKVDVYGNAEISPASDSEPYIAIISMSTPVDGNNNPKPSIPAATSQPQGSPSSACSDFQRTIILIEKLTSPGQDLFVRGGIDHGHRSGCSSNARASPCSIPIRHIQEGSSSIYAKSNAWAVGDQVLDWMGSEPGQGTYQGRQAEGTPALFTTNDVNDVAYNELNSFGPFYWLVDLEMDCSKTEGGYFEFKAVLNGEWEAINPTSTACTGDGAGTPPYTSGNHFARCGYQNVFHFNQAACEIHSM